MRDMMIEHILGVFLSVENILFDSLFAVISRDASVKMQCAFNYLVDRPLLV